MLVEYDGSGFNGWQLQRGSEARSVQGALETALEQVADCPLRVHCAGRTDVGVHATNQVIHFDSPNYRTEQSWLRGCNANLPTAVTVHAACAVNSDFHARFSALSRRYRYVIANAPVAPAIAAAYLSWVRQPLAVSGMHEAAQGLLGEHDFSSFRAAACQSGTAMRRVDHIRVQRSGDLVVVDIQANGFLHRMVRNIVGALIEVGRGRMNAAAVAQLLEKKDRTLAPDTAPANGLYLVEVAYPALFSLPRRSPGPLFVNL